MASQTEISSHFQFQLDEFYLDLQEDGSKISLLNEKAIAKNPFPGLRPFRTSESQLFKGRGGQEEELIKRLKKNHFLAVIGSSGTGKSSLVRAGLIPQLFGGYLHGAGSNWNIAICRPGKDPVANLSIALSSILGRSKEREVIAESFAVIEPMLSDSVYGILEVNELLNVKSHEKNRSNLLIIVDQFEELFRFNRENLGKENIENHFVNLLLKASLNASGLVYVIITMRSEFLGDCVKYRDLPEAINNGQYLVPQLNRNQLKEAIEGPLQLADKKIDQGLVELLINEIDEGKLKENLDQLPILQHALMRTYRKANEQGSNEEIDYEHYDAIGGMKMALANHAELKYDELGGPGNDDLNLSKKQKIAKIVFQALTDMSSDQKGGRRPTELKKIYGIAQMLNASEGEVNEVINHFRDGETCFIMPPIDTTLYPELILDISHESLMRNWKSLKNWITEEVKYGKLYKTLNERRELSQQPDMKDQWIRGGLLEEMLNWRKNYPINSTWASRYHAHVDTNEQHAIIFNSNLEFLDQSRQQVQLQKKKEERRKKILVSIFAIAAVISFSFGLLALSEAHEANTQKKNALRAKDSLHRDDQIIIAEREKTLANDSSRIAALNEARSAVLVRNAALIKADQADKQRNTALAAAQMQKQNALLKDEISRVRLYEQGKKDDSLVASERRATKALYLYSLTKKDWWDSDLDSNLNNKIADTLFSLRHPPNGPDPEKTKAANKIETSLTLIDDAKSEKNEGFAIYTYLLGTAKDTSSNYITNYYVDSIAKITIPYQNRITLPKTDSSGTNQDAQDIVLRFLPHSNRSFIAGTPNGFFYYKSNSNKPVSNIISFGAREKAIAISDNSSKLLSYDMENQEFIVYSRSDNAITDRYEIKIEKNSKSYPSNIRGVFSADNQFLALYDGRDNYEIYDLNKKEIYERNSPKYYIKNFEFSSDGNELLICSARDVFVVYLKDTAKPKPRRSINFDDPYTNTYVFLKATFIANDSISVVSSRYKYTGRIDKPLQRTGYFESTISSYISTSTKSVDIAVEGNDAAGSKIQVFDKERKTTKQFPWHINAIKAIDIADDGQSVASADNGSIYFWNFNDQLKADSLKFYVQPAKLSAYYNDLGVTEYTKKNYAAAGVYYTKSVEADSSNAKAWNMLGLISNQTGKYKLANKQFMKAVDYERKNVTYLTNLGNSYFYHTVINWMKADSILHTALKLDTGNSNTWNELGVLSYRRKMYDQAVVDYREALTHAPNDLVCLRNLGNMYYLLKKYASADSLYIKAIKLDSTNAATWNSWGVTLYDGHEFKKAIEKYTKAVEINNKNVTYLTNLGEAYYRVNEYRSGDSILKSALQQDSTNRLLDILGDRSRNLHKYDLSVNYFQIELKLDSNNYSPWDGLIYTYMDMGNLKAASKASKQAIKNRKADDWNYYNNTSVAMNRLSNFAIAKLYADTAINLDSASANPFAHRGFAMLRLGDYNKAKIDFDKALKIDSYYPKTYFYYACYYALINDKNNAIKFLKTAIDKGFSETGWLENEESLANIRNEKEYIDLIKQYEIQINR